MITIIKDIPKGGTTGNPIWMRAKTNNYQSLVSPSYAIVSSSTPMADGQTLVLEFNNRRITLTLKNYPDPNDPYQVAFDVSDPEVLANHLNSVRAISQYYIIASDPLGFTMTAREIDHKWDVTNSVSSPGSLAVTSSLTVASIPAVLSAAKPSFKGYVEVFLQEDYEAQRDQSNHIGILDADPHREVIDETLVSNEDLLDWELQELIEPYFKIVKPSINGAPFISGVLLNFWIKLYESYGTPPQPGLMISIANANDYYQVLRGSIAHHEWTSQGVHNTYLKGAAAANRLWLTNIPQSKKVAINSHEWLSCYYTALHNMCIRVTVTYYDGTTYSYNTTLTLDGSLVYNTVACFGVGPAQIDLATKVVIADVAYYDVALYDLTTLANISVSQRYTIDHSAYLNEREIVFLGQLGNWETARFTGKEVSQYENEAIEATASRTPWNTAEPRYIKAKTKRDRVIEFSSGYQREDEIEWLNELLISEQVYLIENGALLPMAIETTGGGSFGDVYSDLHAATFKGRIANKV